MLKRNSGYDSHDTTSPSSFPISCKHKSLAVPSASSAKASGAQKRTAGDSSAGCDQRQLVARHACFVCIVTTRANLMCGQWVIVLVDVYIT